ncbi:MAG: leucine-rich repeat domain-containing protein [Clostridia bacterium]|nr:leucine-rich repeat domain-containing protein [Clostridia bacterium]
MKKFVKILSIILCIAFCLTFLGCETEKPCAHYYGDWQSDGINHYRQCECGDKTSISPHVGGTATHEKKAVCDVCLLSYGERIASEGLSFELDGDQYTLVGLGDCVDQIVVVPATYQDKKVTKIARWAFYNDMITEIALPNTITTIEDEAFYGCYSLKKVELGNNIKTIGKWAFQGCDTLANINLPDSIEIIDDWAFDGCRKLVGLTLPKNLKRIGNFAFYNCSSLTSLTFYGKLNYIGEEAFARCTKVASITYYGSQENWKAIQKGNDWNQWITKATSVLCVYGSVNIK